MDESKMTKVNNDFFILPDSKLGEGAFGEVHKGWWKSKNKSVAIKIVQAEEDYER
jgi:serine/threonine protein kinase